MKIPPKGQGPFQRGERLTAAKLNEYVAQKPVRVYGQGHVEGDAVLVDSPESMWIRLIEKQTNAPIRYGWKRVSRLENGTWQDLTHTGNVTNDYAIEVNNASLTVNTTTVYRAERSATTGEWLFQQAGGGSSGNFTANSSETVLMILGPWTEYANCPNAPAAPPMAYTDFCAETRGNTPCVDAYAFAAYQRCGYVWNKIGDSRTYGVWATEMNGGSFSAWRRFVIPRWGGNLTETGPDPDSDCMGVAFLGYASQAALTCTCPSWASDANNCVQVTFRTIPRPCALPNLSCGYTDCADVFTLFDAGDTEGPYWDREFTVEITGSMCSNGAQFGGGSGAGNVGIVYEDRAQDECYWGPDVFDPCDPCDGFGAFRLSIELNADERPNCGIGHVFATIPQSSMKALLCDCISPTLEGIEVCDGCDGGVGLDPLVVIDTDSIVISCCPDPEPPPDNLLAYYLPGVNQTSGLTASWGNEGSWTTTDIAMTQSTSSRVPSIVSVSGFDAFSFVDDATAANDDYLIATPTGYSFLNGKAGATIFAVFEFNSAQTADGGIFGIQNGAAVYAAAVHIVMLNSGGTMYPAILYRRTASDSDTTVTSSVGMSNGSLYTVIGRVNFANGSQAFKINVNGTETTGTAPTGTPYSFTCYNESPVVGVLRRGTTNPSWPSTVKVLECGAYDVYLDDTDTAQLEEYLTWKYGL